MTLVAYYCTYISEHLSTLIREAFLCSRYQLKQRTTSGKCTENKILRNVQLLFRHSDHTMLCLKTWGSLQKGDYKEVLEPGIVNNFNKQCF